MSNRQSPEDKKPPQPQDDEWEGALPRDPSAQPTAMISEEVKERKSN